MAVGGMCQLLTGKNGRGGDGTDPQIRMGSAARSKPHCRPRTESKAPTLVCQRTCWPMDGGGKVASYDLTPLPAGWRPYTPSHSALPLLIQGKETACSGQRCVKVWYGGGLVQKLRVKKGVPVTVRARVRGEVQE